MESSKISKNSCVESSNVCGRNHQDNYFLINVACKSDANMIKWLHAAFSPISSCRKWFEVILWRIYYIMSCVRPQHGGGPDCFHPKWAVNSSYSWNVDCFQTRWCICHSVGIGIKGSSRNRVNAAMNLVSIVAGCSRWQINLIMKIYVIMSHLTADCIHIWKLQ